jgi:hypothetical protein
MGLTMKQRQAVTAVTVQRYRQSSKKVKQQILDLCCVRSYVVLRG